MKSYIRFAFTVFAATFIFGSLAKADADACFVGDGPVPTAEINNINQEGSNLAPVGQTDFMASGLRCQDLRPYIVGLDATSYAFYITSAGMACTGVGATASIVVYGAGIIVHGLNFVVKNLPCEPNIPEDVIERRVEKKVCEILSESGFDCRSKKMSQP